MADTINTLNGLVATHQVLIESLLSIVSDESPALRHRITDVLDKAAIVIARERDAGKYGSDTADGMLQSLTQAREALTLKDTEPS